MKKVVLWLFLFFLMEFLSVSENSFCKVNNYLVGVELKAKGDLDIIRISDFKAFTRSAGYILGEADQNILNQLKDNGIIFTILDEEPQNHSYYFVWYRGNEPLSQALELVKTKGRVLNQEDKVFLVKGKPEDIEELSQYQMSLQRIFQVPLSLESAEPEKGLYKTAGYSEVIANMITKVEGDEVLDYVKDLSGERSVLIEGVPDLIPTRYTYSPACYKAAKYLVEKFTEMGVEAYPDTFYLPYDGLLSDVKTASDGQTAWLCSNRGWILRTVDGGVHWFTVEGTEQFKLSRLFKLTDDTIWAVGFTGLVVNSTDKGVTWTEKTNPTTKNLLGVYFENNLSGWVVGDSGKIYYTSDGGTSWVIQVSGTANLLNNIAFTDPDEGWIVGANGCLLHTTDKGLSWSSVSLGITRDLYDIEFVTPLKGWVVGGLGTAQYTSNGGLNWLSRDVGMVTNIDAVCFSPVDTLKGWMITFVGKTISRTQDGGETWTTKSTRSGYERIEFVNSTVGWAVGGMSLAKSADAGWTWSSQFGNLAAGNPYINVVATIPGAIHPTYEYLITAHYDDISQTAMSYAPGADDNASGTAAVLEAAAVMKDYNFQNTVKFVCFPAEEQGLIGSYMYAGKASSRGDNIRGVLNFDMISYDGNHDGHIEVHTDSNSMYLADLFISTISDYELGFTTNKIIINTGNDYSDHASFWEYGYKAILGIEDDYDFNPYYHRTGDKISAFDTTYFRKYCQAGLAAFATLAIPYYDLKGDVNLDMKVSISDVVYLINYLFKGSPAPSFPSLADVNCSGDIDASDVIYLINYLFKGGPAPCS
jgi:photosystem II stability/assembly factor-like uncharacterized protein